MLENLKSSTSEAVALAPEGEVGALQTPEPVTVLDLVQRQAFTNAHAPAIASVEESITYGELQERADCVARFLRAQGVGPGAAVAVVLPRSVQFPVAVYGVMLSGAAYVPFDPTTPMDRLRGMLEDAGVRVMLTLASLCEHVPSGAWRVVAIESDIPGTSVMPGISLQRPVVSTDVAYVIFTSGSTGRPKGVEVSHASLLNLVNWHCSAFGIQHYDRATQIASPGFDAAVWELWPYLAQGASIWIPDEDTRVTPERLRDWLVSEHISVAFAPTPLAEALLELDWPQDAGLRWLLTGGDTLHRYPPVGLPFCLVNNYGPTECTVVATSGVVEPDGAAGELPNIGKSITGIQTRVVDGHGALVPQGEVGELWLGGTGLSLGYRNQSALTAERFVAVPSLGGSGDRYYRTGDLVRQRPDGSFDFVGRNDDQVKIRGHRIELEEITAVLTQHPGVAAASVAARYDGRNGLRLVAYTVMREGMRWDPANMRQFLMARLPEVMAPSQYVQIDRLPLTVSGKVDRVALPDPTADDSVRTAAYRAPETPVEETLAALVSALLNLPGVSVDDNFFFLGGHSLLGTQLIARIRDTFAVDLSLRVVFDAPTVAELSAIVEDALLARIDAMSDQEAESLLH